MYASGCNHTLFLSRTLVLSLLRGGKALVITRQLYQYRAGGGREMNGWSQNAGPVILLAQVTLCYRAAEALIADTH